MTKLIIFIAPYLYIFTCLCVMSKEEDMHSRRQSSNQLHLQREVTCPLRAPSTTPSLSVLLLSPFLSPPPSLSSCSLESKLSCYKEPHGQAYMSRNLSPGSSVREPETCPQQV